MDPKLEARFAQAMGENVAWFYAHSQELLSHHPESLGKNLAIAVCTPSKVLAVGTSRKEVLDAGLLSPELLEQASQERVPPGILVTAVIFNDEL